MDTFPYAGTTTTCEALFMGVPVVTLKPAAHNHAHSVGVSLLARIDGLKMLVANSEQEVRHAVPCARAFPCHALVFMALPLFIGTRTVHCDCGGPGQERHEAAGCASI